MKIEKDTGYKEQYNYKINKNMDNEEYEELTVEITLAEYRELLKQNAINQYNYDKLQQEKWKAEQEIEKLKEKILSLTEPLQVRCVSEIDEEEEYK